MLFIFYFNKQKKVKETVVFHDDVALDSTVVKARIFIEVSETTTPYSMWQKFEISNM